MPLWIIWVILGIIGAVVVLTSLWGTEQDKRKNYLEALAKFMDSRVEPIEGQENSFRIRFRYKDWDFVFENLEEKGFQKNVIYKGYLKGYTNVDIIFGFTEKSRATLREKISSFADVMSPWLQNVGKVVLPEKLKEFNAFTNDPNFITKVLAVDEVVKALEKYKNRDSRGHPFMAWEIKEGVVTLNFSQQMGVNPCLFDLQHNVASIEDYLNRMLVIMETIKDVQEKEKR